MRNKALVTFLPPRCSRAHLRPSLLLLLPTHASGPHHPRIPSSQARSITVRSTPTAANPSNPLLSDPEDSTAKHTLSHPGSPPDVTFTTHGPSSSLLQIHLSASQPLHTRRGALLALTAPTGLHSSLSPLPPLKRILAGIPFIYQRLTSTSPTTLLLTSAPQSFVVLSLDGTVDWRVLPRNSLVAWSGSGASLRLLPQFSAQSPGLANWSSQLVTGRGLVALTARGGGYETRLKEGEEILAHPSHVVAYSVGLNTPEAYRLHAGVRIGIPDFGRYLPESKFLQSVRGSRTYRLMGRAWHQIKLWMRAIVWGERVYLRFRGPGTVVLQGRHGGTLNGTKDAYNERDVANWADTPSGAVERSVSRAAWERGHGADERALKTQEMAAQGQGEAVSAGKDEALQYASVGKNGKVAWVKE